MASTSPNGFQAICTFTSFYYSLGGLHSAGEAAGPAPEAEAEDVRGVEPDHSGRLHRQGDGRQREDRWGHGGDDQDHGAGMHYSPDLELQLCLQTSYFSAKNLLNSKISGP